MTDPQENEAREGRNPLSNIGINNQLANAERYLNAQTAVGELLHLLSSIREYEARVLQALRSFGVDPDRPQGGAAPSRAEALKEYIAKRPDLTVRVVDVPGILRTLGFVSKQAKPQKNWLYAKHSKARDYFDVKDGIVKLKPGIRNSPPTSPSHPKT